MPVSPCHQAYDITQLREVALAGDVGRIRAILPGSRGNDGEDGLFVQHTAPILSEAIENDSVDVVEALLDCDVPMNIQLFLKATRNTSYRILDAFLHHGWDISPTGSLGTPLHYAAARGLLDSVKLLIENGASPRIKAPGGKRALEWAEANGQSLVAEFLRPLSIDRGLETPSQLAAENGCQFSTVPMEQFLRESGYQLV
ncbi:ankyrin repeat-containing domain protein [Aspergillus egyptiacus]|nr:ankyrin repeat-containing domain protein [Aspergillus egyptiacus]